MLMRVRYLLEGLYDLCRILKGTSLPGRLDGS